jgi:acyl dehydratase
MTEIVDIGALQNRIGEEIAVSDWVEISQERITQFAETTDDRQWIHVDAARAATESPFKTTIAHGFLTLSLASALLRSAIRIGPQHIGINYGVNRVRFVAPVPAGSHIRGRFAPAAVEQISAGYQVIWAVTIEREGSDRPCCVAEWIVWYLLSSR